MRRVSLRYAIAKDSSTNDKNSNTNAIYLFRSTRESCGQKLCGIFYRTLIKRAAIAVIDV